MTTNESNITKDKAPVQAANLVAKLEGGQAAGESARLPNDARTPEGQAYAQAFSDTAAACVRELRERDPLPEPDRTPGALHPDPFLAGRGWHINEHGIYTRRAQPEPQAPERELEAGLWQPGSRTGRTGDLRYPPHSRPASVTGTPGRPRWRRGELQARPGPARSGGRDPASPRRSWSHD